MNPEDVTAVATTVKRALTTYDTPALAEMIQNCMAQDLSWKVSYSNDNLPATALFINSNYLINIMTWHRDLLKSGRKCC